MEWIFQVKNTKLIFNANLLHDQVMEHVCIECDHGVEELYIEFGGKDNLKLVRCNHCGEVADKYIEYELILVVLDVILHRKQAYRHLLFNRKYFTSASYSIAVFLVVLIVNVSTKFIVFHESSSWFKQWSPFIQLTFLLVTSFLEHAVFVMTILVSLWYYRLKFHRLLYVSIALPELLKVCASVLQIFDNGSTILFIIGLLLISIQYTSFQSIMNIPNQKGLIILLCGTMFRILCRLQCHTISDVKLLGFIL